MDQSSGLEEIRFTTLLVEKAVRRVSTTRHADGRRWSSKRFLDHHRELHLMSSHWPKSLIFFLAEWRIISQYHSRTLTLSGGRNRHRMCCWDVVLKILGTLMETGIHRSFGMVSRRSQYQVKHLQTHTHVGRRAADKNSSNVKVRLSMVRDLVGIGERKIEVDYWKNRSSTMRGWRQSCVRVIHIHPARAFWSCVFDVDAKNVPFVLFPSLLSSFNASPSRSTTTSQTCPRSGWITTSAPASHWRESGRLTDSAPGNEYNIERVGFDSGKWNRFQIKCRSWKFQVHWQENVDLAARKLGLKDLTRPKCEEDSSSTGKPDARPTNLVLYGQCKEGVSSQGSGSLVNPWNEYNRKRVSLAAGKCGGSS